MFLGSYPPPLRHPNEPRLTKNFPCSFPFRKGEYSYEGKRTRIYNTKRGTSRDTYCVYVYSAINDFFSAVQWRIFEGRGREVLKFRRSGRLWEKLLAIWRVDECGEGRIG